MSRGIYGTGRWPPTPEGSPQAPPVADRVTALMPRPWPAHGWYSHASPGLSCPLEIGMKRAAAMLTAAVGCAVLGYQAHAFEMFTDWEPTEELHVMTFVEVDRNMQS